MHNRIVGPILRPVAIGILAGAATFYALTAVSAQGPGAEPAPMGGNRLGIGASPNPGGIPQTVAAPSAFQHWYMPRWGSPERGAYAIVHKYGCPACHTIDGLPNARGLVGPPLTNVMKRVYIAGLLVNIPENTMYWIMHPQKVLPNVTMPPMGVAEDDARDIVAYLLSLVENKQE